MQKMQSKPQARPGPRISQVKKHHHARRAQASRLGVYQDCWRRSWCSAMMILRTERVALVQICNITWDEIRMDVETQDGDDLAHGTSFFIARCRCLWSSGIGRQATFIGRRQKKQNIC